MPETSERLPYLTVGEAAALIGITEQSVRRLAGQGLLQALKPGRDWLIDAAAARAYAERERRPGRPRRQ
jgi:excisionase family DNA binding protein